MDRLIVRHPILILIYLLGAIVATGSRRLDKKFLVEHSASYRKTAHQSTLEKSNADRAVDGDNTTCSKTKTTTDPWWEVDIGQTINVSTIEIQNSQKHPLVIYIYVRQNTHGKGRGCGVKHILEGGETRLISCVPPISGSAVKILTRGKQQSLSLCEVQVFDDTVPFAEGVTYGAWFNVTPSQDSFTFINNDNPDSRGVVSSFQSPRDIADHYGIKMITYYNPPLNGNYTFYMSGDGNCRLYKRGMNETKSEPIAAISRSDETEPWPLFDDWNRSNPKTVLLLKEKIYELTALMKEDTSGDHLRVGVRLPNGDYERPMKKRIFTSAEAAKRSVNKVTEIEDEDNSPYNSSGDGSETRFLIEAAVQRYESDGTVSKTKVLDKLEKLGLEKAKSLTLGDKAFSSFVSRKNNFVLAAVAISLDKYHGFKFPGDVENATFFNDGSITFPDTAFGSNIGRASMVCMTYEPLREMKDKTGNDKNYLGSNVLSAVVEPDIGKNLTTPIELVFKNTMKIGKNEPYCVFWIENNRSENLGRFGRWSDEGCTVVNKNDTHTVCHCNHLTKFAVLFPVAEGSKEDELNLELITYIGLTLSAAGCFITFAVYLILRITGTLKAIVHLNLVFALGLADLAFLFGNFAQNDKEACFGSTILTFYLFLAVFAWMLVEGIHLYFLVIRVFGSDDYRRKRYYYFVGWGIPLIIVIITSGVLEFELVSEKHCWLSIKNGAVWAFIAPALLVIFINTFILACVLRTTMTILRRDPGHSKERSAMRTLAMLLPLLGITWVFGILAFANDSIVFQYIFAVFNAFQGLFIFILYCLINTEVRNEYKKKVKAWKTEREIESKKSKQPESLDLMARSENVG